jgi:multicomponent Na+:H+ antiporter subunit B
MKNDSTGMTLIVKTITRLTVGLILIYGIFIAVGAHHAPGGGFAGGIIIALSFIHLMLAFGREAALKRLTQTRGLILTSLAGLLLVAVAAFLVSGVYAFKLDMAQLGGPLVTACDILIAVIVGAGAFTIFLTLVSSEMETKKAQS